jgi:hypothetical protein
MVRCCASGRAELVGRHDDVYTGRDGYDQNNVVNETSHSYAIAIHVQIAQPKCEGEDAEEIGMAITY